MTRRRGDKPAQYLLRFDDLCPQMSGTKWKRFLPLLEEYGVKPILAVVPDNRDLTLAGDELGSRLVEEVFWDQMRQLAAGGATIGMHGFQHLCQARGRSLIPLHGLSEFAGIEESVQREWIQAGIGLLRHQHLVPRIWVAPRHGFDRTTVEVLLTAGIELISDGFATVPFRWLGAKWLPQQLWQPVERECGLWTICVHPSTASDREIQQLGHFLQQFGSCFRSVDQVMEEWNMEARSLRDRAFQFRSLVRIRASGWVKSFRSKAV